MNPQVLIAGAVPTRPMFAGANVRGGALVLDLIVVLALLVATKLTVEVALDREPQWLTYAVLAAYFVGLPLTRLQGTFGKRGCGIKITDLAGNRIGPGRSLLRFAGSLASIALVGLGYALCFWNPRRRTLHDWIAGTVVVDAKATRAEIAAATPAPMPPARRVIKTAVFLICFLAPLWFFWVGMNARVAYQANAMNLGEAKRVVAALEEFKRRNGRYPTSLAALRPAYLSSDPKLHERTRLYYLDTHDGAGCSLAIVYWLRPGFLPSDDGNEYDCAAREWQVKDFNALRARGENGFAPKGAP